MTFEWLHLQSEYLPSLSGTKKQTKITLFYFILFCIAKNLFKDCLVIATAYVILVRQQPQWMAPSSQRARSV